MGRFGRLLGAAFSVGAGALAAPFLLRVAWSWPHRVAVSGHSMEPTLLDGDWLLVDPDAYLTRRPQPRELVVARDPRAEGRVIIKRVAESDELGFTVAGDHPAHAGDAPEIGRLVDGHLIGRPWLRYWPPSRIGRL
ncbi:MAG: S26 family signal peptidase [Candidatus Limnocylindrales bacterium]